MSKIVETKNSTQEEAFNLEVQTSLKAGCGEERREWHDRDHDRHEGWGDRGDRGGWHRHGW
jgi:hypothetical protein